MSILNHSFSSISSQGAAYCSKDDSSRLNGLSTSPKNEGKASSTTSIVGILYALSTIRPSSRIFVSDRFAIRHQTQREWISSEKETLEGRNIELSGPYQTRSRRRWEPEHIPTQTSEFPSGKMSKRLQIQCPKCEKIPRLLKLPKTQKPVLFRLPYSESAGQQFVYTHDSEPFRSHGSVSYLSFV